MPLYKKLPIRGFSNGRFRTVVRGINFRFIESLYKDGETVSKETLRKKGF